MATEGGGKILDIVEAQMVDCAPNEPVVLSVNVSAPPDHATPVVQAMAATIEQTGADPPPSGGQ